ncbi:MAG: alpha-glucosidase C-terminal domain-containing protein [Bacteroidales bacterium]|nr:alpha-glucosidase C-terminal domain-containing protein [Bacteroidales bacterium]
MKIVYNLIFFPITLLISSCGQFSSQNEGVITCEYKIEINDLKGPEWSKGLPVYQVFLQRHTKEGTINAFSKELPRLKEMGIGIIWLMPIHPMGELRDGDRNSFCIKDHFGVAGPLGTKEDLKQLLDDIHNSGMFAILGVVPNHTSYDNPLITTHPEYYVRRDDGTISHVGPWKTIAQLDYSIKEVREYACSYLKYWADFGFDGFRVDVAGMIHDDFWAQCILKINKEHPNFFWLSESNKESHHDLFDMTYDWSTAPHLWKIFWNEWPATKLDSLLKKEKPYLEKGALIMRHANNHDLHISLYPPSFTNMIPLEILRQRGNVYDNYGEGLEVANLLYATLPGKFMIYNGQEANYRGPLPHNTMINASIEWGDKSMYQFYKSLFELHKNFPAIYKGTFYKLKTNNDKNIFAFMREFGDERVLVLTNLSGENKIVQIESNIRERKWEEYFTGEKIRSLNDIELGPYGYKVYTSK